MKKDIKIMLSGGGTGGSVSPLLALVEASSNEEQYSFVFVGTYTGPEREMIKQCSSDIRFIPIISGKWRKYISVLNLIDSFKIILAFIQSIILLLKERPKVLITAGSFVSVPLASAAYLLNIPVIVHQQDLRPGLANRLMAPMAKVITVSFEKSLLDFNKKARWIGNPVEPIDLDSKKEILKRYNLSDNKLILVIGGGTGAVGLNALISEALEYFDVQDNIIHLTGDNKGKEIVRENYQSFSFLAHKEVINLMSISTIVITRCGIGVLSELSFLGKASILVPMPYSHQEDNAKLFADHQAGIIVNQNKVSGEELAKIVNDLLNDKEHIDKLANNISRINKRGADQVMWRIIKDLL